MWCTLSVEKIPEKSDHFFSGDQYFSPTDNLIRLKLITTINFYQLVFLLNRNKITEHLKKIIRYFIP